MRPSWCVISPRVRGVGSTTVTRKCAADLRRAPIRYAGTIWICRWSGGFRKGGSTVAQVNTVDVRAYRGHVLWGPFDAAGPKDIELVEQVIGRALPRDYRDFILAANGGTLPYAVRLPPEGDGGRLLEFSTLRSLRGNFSLATAWTNFGSTVMAEHLPHGLLAVAQDGGGSTLYIDLRDESFGSVWAFVFGLPEWTGSSTTNMGGLDASNWDAYMHMLTIEEDYAQEVWQEAQIDPDEDWTRAVVAWLDSGLPDWRTAAWAGP